MRRLCRSVVAGWQGSNHRSPAERALESGQRETPFMPLLMMAMVRPAPAALQRKVDPFELEILPVVVVLYAEPPVGFDLECQIVAVGGCDETLKVGTMLWYALRR